MAAPKDRFIRIKGDKGRRYFDTVTETIVSDFQVRKLRELAGTRTRLEAEQLARQRSQQASYNALIREVTRPQLAAIDQQLFATQQALAELEMDPTISDQLRRDLAKQLKAEIKRIDKSRAGIKQSAIRDPGIKKAKRLLDSAGPDEDGNRKRLEALELLGRRGPGTAYDIPDWVPAGSSDDYMQGKLKRSKIAKWRYSGARTYNEYKRRMMRANATGRNGPGAARPAKPSRRAKT